MGVNPVWVLVFGVEFESICVFDHDLSQQISIHAQNGIELRIELRVQDIYKGGSSHHREQKLSHQNHHA
jgi:hypothetical protein